MAMATEGGVDRFSTRPGTDELFEVLSNKRRRYAVHALKQRSEPAQIGDLAERVAAWEYDVDRSELSYDERKRVYTALQQSHLPKMDAAGIVSFDKQRGVIEPEPALEDADVYIDVVQGREIPWSQYYLSLSVVAMVITAAIGLGAGPLMVLPEISWMAGIVVMFLISSLVHTYYAQATRIGADDTPIELGR